jgi:hypothetical protein
MRIRASELDAADPVGVVILGHRQAGVTGRDAAAQRGADVLGDVDGDDGRDRRHDLARLLLVEVEDAGEHPRLAGVELAAGVGLGDERAHLLGAGPLLEARLGLDAERAQHGVGRLVEEVDERPHEPVEDVQRPRDALGDGLGVDDRVDLRHLLADRDVPRRDEHVRDRDRDRGRDGVRETLEGRLDELGDGGLAEEADAQRGERDPELAGREVLAELVELAHDERRAPVALLGHVLDARAARAHEGELRGDEEAVREDQDDDRDEKRRGQAAGTVSGLGGRP